MPRPRAALEQRTDFARDDPRGGGTLRVHLLDARREDQIGPARERIQVGVEVARVAGEVLVRAELGGIDEDRDHDRVRELACPRDVGEVAGVQRTEGGDEGDRSAGERLAHPRDRRDHGGAAGHRSMLVGAERAFSTEERTSGDTIPAGDSTPISVSTSRAWRTMDAEKLVAIATASA